VSRRSLEESDSGLDFWNDDPRPKRPRYQHWLQEQSVVMHEVSQAGVSCYVPTMNPNSQWRTWWAVAGLAMVCFDLINVPLQVYDLPANWFTVTMDWTTLLFWTFDSMQSFFVGYYVNGELIMSLRRIIPRHLKTWFLVDMLVVGPDWALKVSGFGGEQNTNGFSRLLRGARAVRVLRLLRIMKLQHIVSMLYDLIEDEHSFLMAELVKMMCVILVLNHVIACGWFLVGTTGLSMGMPSWLSWSEDFIELGTGYQYATSLHWTLTQFTPASMDVVARNILERCYSIVILLFAMVAFSSIVGTVTTSMTVIRQMKDDKQKQFWKLRRYLNQRNISSDLTFRMLRFVEYQTGKEERTIQQGSVAMLGKLSDQLASELAHEMYASVIQAHAFFWHVSTEMKAVARRLCHVALKAQQLATADVLFSVGEEAGLAYAVKSGDLCYTLRDGAQLEPPLCEKEWLAEAVLWTPWRYRGRCVAEAPSEVLAFDPARFLEVMSTHPQSLVFARSYGQRLVSLLNNQPPYAWTDVLRREDFRASAVQECARLEHGDPEATEEEDGPGEAERGKDATDAGDAAFKGGLPDGGQADAGGLGTPKARAGLPSCLLTTCFGPWPRPPT